MELYKNPGIPIQRENYTFILEEQKDKSEYHKQIVTLFPGSKTYEIKESHHESKVSNFFQVIDIFRNLLDKEFQKIEDFGIKTPEKVTTQSGVAKPDSKLNSQVNSKDKSTRSNRSSNLNKSTIPTTERGLKKWKQAYAIIVGLRKKYKIEYNDGDSKKPTPSTADIQDALIDLYGRELCKRTVEKILAAGKENMLK